MYHKISPSLFTHLWPYLLKLHVSKCQYCDIQMHRALNAANIFKCRRFNQHDDISQKLHSYILVKLIKMSKGRQTVTIFYFMKCV